MKRMTLAWLFFLGMCLGAQNVVENSDFSVMTGKNKGAMLWNVTYSGDKNPVNYIREDDKGYYQFSADKRAVESYQISGA